MQKFCSQCGAKLEKEFKFCPACGTSITVKKGKDTQPAPKVHQEEGKNLNPKVIYGIVLIGIVAVVVALLTSGMLESDITPPVTNQNINSGVNLNNVSQINQLEQKIKENPSDHESLLQLAHLKNDSGLFDAAIQDYKKYLSTHPDNADARIDMGVCYFNLGNSKAGMGDNAGAQQLYQTAISEMETALKYAPKHQIGHLNLGVVNLTSGNIEKAKEWLKKAVELDPNSEIGKKAQSLLTSH